MGALVNLQSWIGLVLGVVVLAATVFAFVDALRYRKDAYVAAGKLTKPAWCGITGVCVLLAVLAVLNPLSLTGILAIVGAGVFLADVRPALHQVLGKSRDNNAGPYGPW